MASTTPDLRLPSHHRPLTDSSLYCLVTEARECEQLAQGCYLEMQGRESNSRLLSRKSSVLTITLPGHANYSRMVLYIFDIDRVTVTSFHSIYIYMPAGFRRHLVDKTLINVRCCDIT